MRYTGCASSDLNQQGNPSEEAHFLVGFTDSHENIFLLLNNLWGENKRTKSFAAAFTSSKKSMKIRAESLLRDKYTRKKKVVVEGDDSVWDKNYNLILLFKIISVEIAVP